MRAVVTGASSGIGAATVQALRARGWDVVAVARRAERLAAVAAQTGATFVAADLTVPSEVERLVQHVTAAGPVDCLVNNAGGALGKHLIGEADLDVWRRMYELNVLATVNVTRSFLPALLATGAGTVLFLTSAAAHEPYPGGAGYTMAKYAERVLAETLRLEHIADDLRVIEIAPGMVKTEEFSKVRFDGDQAKFDEVYAGVSAPLLAEDVAEAIAWAVSLPHHVCVDSMIVRPVAQRRDNAVRRDS